MSQRVIYPIGEQSFAKIREKGMVYVDKTMFIDEILHGGYYFLGRPRRFGKSLFLSTLECFYEGRRELFKGLAAENFDWDWEQWPVLKIDLNLGQFDKPEGLDIILDDYLKKWEALYGITDIAAEVPLRLQNVIRLAYEATGKRVVVLVDEYDRPLVDSLNDRPLYDLFCKKLSAFYANFKTSADYLELVFLTGVSKFGKVSIFSGLNNINDLSFDTQFSAVCGITGSELTEYFSQGISDLANAYGRDAEEIRMELKRYYDGYRFTAKVEDIYNPYSILNAFRKLDIRPYWVESGVPTILLKQLIRHNVELSSLTDYRCSESSLSGLIPDSDILAPLFFQTGYLTIKEYNRANNMLRLGIPNIEVEEGLYEFLLPYYLSINRQKENTKAVISDLVGYLEEGEPEKFMKRLSSLFSGISYRMEVDREQNLHNAFLMLAKLIGLDVETEYATSEGRIDLLVKTDRFIYIFEFKLDATAREALDQIKSKQYALQFKGDPRKVFEIGVNFSSDRRTIGEWKISSPRRGGPGRPRKTDKNKE